MTAINLTKPDHCMYCQVFTFKFHIGKLINQYQNPNNNSLSFNLKPNRILQNLKINYFFLFRYQNHNQMSQQTSSDSTGRPKFTLHNSKLQVYADNAIKRSNVKAFVNQGMKSSERLNLENNLNKNLSHHLLHLKNSCNDLKKDITGKENDATRMKDQTMYTSEKVKELQSQREKLQAKIMNLTKDVEQVHKKKQATFHSFKTYEHILWRMKKDEITNQIRKNNLQKLTINLEKQLKIIQNKLYSLNEYQELSFKGLRQAEQQIQQQAQHRQKKVNQLNSVLEEKKISEIKKQQRHSQTKSIQEMAAGDLQDADLIRMKKFLQVQVFLKCLLKEKMQRLKDYFEPYEMAFFKIKSQTSAKDANSLKTQFFNFQSQYQQRTAWIKHLEEEISGLEIERKQLNQDLCKAKERQLDLLEQFEDPNPKIYDAEHYDQNSQADKDSIWKRSLDSELTAMKVKQWINFQSKKVSMATNTQGEHTAAVAANFNKICDFLLQNKKQQAAKKNISQQPSKGNEEVKV